ncbi:MAG: UDP-N-acetylmuramate--L-alanine ligase [Bacteroidales bacterium]|nr:UDP-N-acetylmuramate--L-alanine ligase [Bacteroidales bacterium]
MNDLNNIKAVYFVGIGGIGMSALALWFRHRGYAVAGYDRTESSITASLEAKGCEIVFEDDPSTLPGLFREKNSGNGILVVRTPAVPAESRLLGYFREKGYRIKKRAEVLGSISRTTDTIAVAGTHGKTTTSVMTAHILKQSRVGCSAFLGGISRNYDTNLLLGQSRFTVMEADEYDRSFHQLDPLMAVITSLDADHLDIYGDLETMTEAYDIFCKRIRPGGILLLNHMIRDRIKKPAGLSVCTYGNEAGADYRNFNIVPREDYYLFSLSTPEGVIEDLRFHFPGRINIENMTAAIAIALKCGVSEAEIRSSVPLFRGVKRRFDIRINMPGLTYIDDYAHHPGEIKACIRSLRDYFRGRKITGIFQPHLFSRTRDHAHEFAEIVDELDEAILLPIYPAREKPLEGVSSELIFNMMKLKNKKLIRPENVLAMLDPDRLDVLVTIGAGDIDRLVDPIEKKLRGGN